MADQELRLKCFLHYGCEEHVYLPRKNMKRSFEPAKVQSIVELLKHEELSLTIVATVMKVFRNGYIIEPYASLYALAMVVRKAKPKEQRKIICEAYRSARKLCEYNAEYFLTFTYYLREIAKLDSRKGFGKGWRATIKNWYWKSDGLLLAEAVTKVGSAENWSHKDVIALCRLKIPEDNIGVSVVMWYILKGYRRTYEHFSNEPEAAMILQYLSVVNQFRKSGSETAVINLINMTGSVEHCPEKFLKSHDVWRALISRMSIESLLSKINYMSRLRLFREQDILDGVVNRFKQDDDLANIHPNYIYAIRKQYEEGPKLALSFKRIQKQKEVEAARDSRTVRRVLKALHRAQKQRPPRRNVELMNSLSFLCMKSISNLAPTGLRYLIALDMAAAVATRRCFFERFVSVEDAAVLVALCVIKTENESNIKLVSFLKSDQGTVKITEIPISKSEENMDTLRGKFCTEDAVSINLKMLISWATTNNEVYDVFIVLSDNKLYTSGGYDALKIYQEKVSPKAKVITCSFTGMHRKSSELIKPDMFLICGFDKNVGRLIEGYSRGSF